MDVSRLAVLPSDRAAFGERPRRIDPAGLEKLHLLGHYRRELPNNLDRMIENARDWEHLPFVHPASFGAIALVEQGGWGWRAKTALPLEAGGGKQLLELLVDASRNAWTTSVVSGSGAGLVIHTRASELARGGIVVEVGFHLPEAPADPALTDRILAALQKQYARLYDEDEALMTGRQGALDAPQADGDGAAFVDLGPVAALDPAHQHRVDLATGRFVVRRWQGEWIVHARTCPHRLGPLDNASIDDAGNVVCPWHGYRYSLATGAEAQGRCRALPEPPSLIVVDGRLRVESRPRL